MVLAALVVALAGPQHGVAGLRPILLFEAIPVLLSPAAVLRVPATREAPQAGWLPPPYAILKLFELTDVPGFSSLAGSAGTR